MDQVKEQNPTYEKAVRVPIGKRILQADFAVPGVCLWRRAVRAWQWKQPPQSAEPVCRASVARGGASNSSDGSVNSRGRCL